jgi:ABC-type Fe3+ transport system permease subunit
LLTLLICLIVAIARWKRHPKVSLIASLVFVSLILHGLIFSAAYIWLPRWFPGADHSDRTLFSMLTLISNSLFAVVLGMLLLAVFIDRRRAPEGA